MISNNSSKGIANKIEKQFSLVVRERMKYLFSALEFLVLVYLSFFPTIKEIQFFSLFLNGEIILLPLSSFGFFKSFLIIV